MQREAPRKKRYRYSPYYSLFLWRTCGKCGSQFRREKGSTRLRRRPIYIYGPYSPPSVREYACATCTVLTEEGGDDE